MVCGRRARQGLIDAITNVLCFMRGVEHEDAKHTVLGCGV